MSKKLSILMVLLVAFMLTACFGPGDTTNPVVTLTGDAEVVIGLDDTFTDEGATATDDVDGELTVVVSGEVDESTEGTYTLTYTATDEAGNEGTATRTVIVDGTDPVFTVDGDLNISVDMNTAFNIFTGVTANDAVSGDVTADIIAESDTVTITDGVMDTSTPGVYQIAYQVEDEAGNKAFLYRNITVAFTGQVFNGDFALGTQGWDEYSEGTFTWSVVDGELEVVIDIISSTSYGVRISQSGNYFEAGETYEVTFDARALEARTLRVQVGELLTAAPWFIDFKPGQTDHFMLSTEMETYTFKFTMNAAQDSTNGGILFEMGTIDEEAIATTIYIDNVTITVAEPDPDLVAPTFSGADDATLPVGADFDPLTGVTAFDIVDGDLDMANATVVIEDELGAVVETIDTSVAGVYTITYEIADAAGNVASIERVVQVVDLVFVDSGRITDGSFDTTTEIIDEVQDAENGYADITDPNIWYKYIAGWDGAAATVNVTGNAAVYDITAPGNSDWGVMLKQRGIELVKGETYRLLVTASATVDRDITVKLDGVNAASFDLTSTATVFELIFTHVGDDTVDAKLEILMGNTASYAAGVVTIDDVVLEVLDEPVMISNGTFDQYGVGEMWTAAGADWAGYANATFEVVNETLNVDVLTAGVVWGNQVKFEGFELAAATTYKFVFEASSTVARNIDVTIGTRNGDWAELTRQTFALTDTLAQYEFVFTTVDALLGDVEIVFELGGSRNEQGTPLDLSDDTFDEIVSLITIDSVYLENEVDTDVFENTNLVYGEFDGLYEWFLWTEQGAGSVSVVDGVAVLDITAVGTDSWRAYDPQFVFEGFNVSNGRQYVIEFDIKASVDRDIQVQFGKGLDADPWFTPFMDAYVVTTSTEWQHISITVDLTAGSFDGAKLVFEVGNINDYVSSFVAHTIEIDNVEIYPVF